MKIIVFTGAGVSRESGLKTFRDSGNGLWDGHDIEAVASIRGWWKDPQRVLDFYNTRRREVCNATPNPAHIALAELEREHEVIVITQNVDDLHERAGSSHVIHLHGSVLRARAADDPEGEGIEWRDDLNLGHMHPETGAQLRPDIVWFGEGLPRLDEALDEALADDVQVLIIVGTTLTVYPAALVATETRAHRVFLVDPNPPPLPVPNLTVIAEPASVGVRKVVEALRVGP